LAQDSLQCPQIRNRAMTMDNLGLRQQSGLQLVDPHQISGTVTSAPPESLGPRVLELTGLLQTTLEVDRQIGLFRREVNRTVRLDGVSLTNETEKLTIESGETSTHRATYQLELHSESLGELRIFRGMPFTTSELTSLENFLCALVYPLRNAMTYRRAVQQALRDPLTGVQNRAALEQALMREVELSKRLDTPLSILVMDIDHFKQFNDEFGHTFGDAALKAVANTAAATIRRSDLLFRFGGEEFVVIASHTDNRGADLLAERMRRNIAALDTIGGKSTNVTVSLGTATLHTDEGGKALFDRADEALYQAKDAGRNRVVSSSKLATVGRFAD